MIRIPYLREAGALIAAGLIAWALWTAYNFAYGNGYNAANVRAEKIIGEFARAEAEAQGRARAAERRQAEAIADITEQYERDRADAQAAANRLAAGLRAGNVRLQKHWAGCETSNLSGDATAARLADEAAQLRRQGAVDLVRLADLADAREQAWRAYAEEVSR